MGRTIRIYEAKNHLYRLIGRVETGETIIISRAGRPVAELRKVNAADPEGAASRIRSFRERHLNRAVPLCTEGRDWSRSRETWSQALMTLVVDPSVAKKWCVPLVTGDVRLAHAARELGLVVEFL